MRIFPRCEGCKRNPNPSMELIAMKPVRDCKNFRPTKEYIELSRLFRYKKGGVRL